MGSISRSTGGTTFPYIKRLYTSVIKPCTQYAAIIWYRPWDKTSPTQKQVTALTTVQRHAMKAMLSTFRTAPTDLLQRGSQTTPVHLSLENQVLKSFTRMQTAPPNHSIHSWIQRARLQHQTTTLSFTSVLEHLARQFPQYAGLGNAAPLETIYPYIVTPWWEKPYGMCISATKDIAEEQHWEAAESNSNNPNLLEVYTDRSRIEGQIGAAAYSPKTSTTTYEYLSPDTTANVFTAELTAIKLATAIFDNLANSSRTSCSIYADSQAALKALDKPGRQSGQYIIAEIIADIENIKRRKQMDLEMGWIPSHEGIPGNEKAD
jgi:ribonuclease HI